MRYLAITIIILCIAALTRGWAASSPAKPVATKCAVCNKPFKDGDDKIERMIKGRFRDIHLDHRDEEKRKSRLALIEPLEEMR